ncbi:MAG: metal ABC transporter ATP-binding protein [Nanoarchaeota archaeon]|nr:metal ABC transporter ATP-binding protein [Nanoarchaeota archaeon]MBU4300636.1 metal ABC transporter ATP-binding protein [Nanoarchaeota archaeon]MBU4452007.1 metal ABC transporter ATP-binding protein [Nanoarchaeota archaeon]MCG2724229.1 metal ABC transporter ATP-binding protein [archaeon]
MSNILQLEKVSFSYGNSDILKDISLSVEKGDFVGLIGPNGSGKTTLLKILLGILTPRKGSVYLFEKDLKRFNNWGKIGYVPQKATNIEKNFPATVYEIVSMGLLSSKKLPKIFTKQDDIKIKNALSVVKMEKCSQKRITELSGGQQQRVLIAKALVTEPEILILDEPTTGVDQENQKSFYDLLGKLNKEGMTIILVSHDIGRITRYVTKIASINQTLNFYGTHKEFCSKDLAHKHEHKLCLDKG